MSHRFPRLANRMWFAWVIHRDRGSEFDARSVGWRARDIRSTRLADVVGMMSALRPSCNSQSLSAPTDQGLSRGGVHGPAFNVEEF